MAVIQRYESLWLQLDIARNTANHGNPRILCELSTQVSVEERELLGLWGMKIVALIVRRQFQDFVGN
ncbi:hypothetical protein FGO68_gene2714 [Halteria grandinella]|uniref:Uncharacterized protein n=1 Tax=Halteria grandinella TaxID=5974 RepID=A0A8J8NFP0_HALGN|nr:hypothetical protein FGO68_gene2714 [Halteria grandinella]